MATMASADSALLNAVKLIHICNGIYLWEFFTTLQFEWEIYTGQRPWRWSFVVYLLARLLALGSVILQFIGFNLQTEFDCNAWFRCVLVFSWAAAAASSFLLGLRAIAIWGQNSFVSALTIFVWCGNIGAAAYSATRGATFWVPAANTCLIEGTSEFRWGILVNTAEDTLLLGIMLVGVVYKKNTTGLWRMLYFQTLAWMAAAALTELPAVILCFLDINDGWNLMFQNPHMVMIVIISTRVYRNLFQYIIGDPDRGYSKKSNNARLRNPNEPEGVHITVHQIVNVDVDLEMSSIEQHPEDPGESMDSDLKGGAAMQSREQLVELPNVEREKGVPFAGI